MRYVPFIVPLVALACSGREPPAISRFDAGVYLADVAGNDAVEVAPSVMEGSQVPEFSLPDLNPSSRTHNMPISPLGLRPRVAVYYFSNAI